MTDLFDIHCHILPGVDDGAKNMKEALKMLEMEYRDGVRDIILTPHFRKEMFEPDMDDVWDYYDMLCRRAKGMGICLYLGCEFHVNMDMIEILDAGERPTMDDSDYVLCEYSSASAASFIRERSHALVSSGYIPILAHIERYPPLVNNFDFIEELKDIGCMMQINADSVLGRAGFKAKQFCKKMIQYDMLDFIASDAHDTKVRVPRMGACAEYLIKKAGEAYAERILSENPYNIIKDR